MNDGSIEEAATTANTKSQIHKFSDRVKYLSNEFRRNFELAHDLVDLHNSKFAYATVAAAQAAVDEQQERIEDETISSDEQQHLPLSSINKICSLSNSNYLSTNLTANDDYTDANSSLNQIDFYVKRTDSFTNIPDGIYISIWEVFIYLWGCIAFFLDIISDIILSVGYYNDNKKWLCSLTLIFVIVPNVTLSLFSLSWYIDNYNTTKKARCNNGDDAAINNKKTTFDSITFWVTTIIFLILQLDLVYKYVLSIF